MLMEGTGLYFWLLFLVFFIVYITVKISLGFLLKRAKEKSWKAYVPFYTTLVLTDLLGLKRSVFYFSLIPFVNLYYYYVIISKFLEGFGLDSKDAIWYVVFPMYKFPQLAFRRPKFKLNEYDLTEEFLVTQNILFEKPKEEISDQNNLVDTDQTALDNGVGGTIIAPFHYEQVPNGEVSNSVNPYADTTYTGESVFSDSAQVPDEKNVTYVEVPKEEPKVQEVKPIITPVDTGRPKVCPNCGAKLAPSATTCFLCGHRLS